MLKVFECSGNLQICVQGIHHCPFPASVKGLDKTDFLNEMEIMKKLFEGGSSPYVVTLVECVTIEEPIRLVTALVRYGNLHEYLTYVRNKVEYCQLHNITYRRIGIHILSFTC